MSSAPAVAPLFDSQEAGGDSAAWKEYLLASARTEAREGTQWRVLDLFSGVGGLLLGFGRAAEIAGGRALSVGAVDTDRAALDVHARNHGTAVTMTSSVASLVDFQIRGAGDSARFLYPPELTSTAPDEFASLDVILAGPPCQGHSSLNNRTRGTDDRNRLYLTVPSIAIATGADVVVVENVPNVVHARQNVVATAAALLENAGYSVTSAVLAADALGWPQTRKRFFLVARRSRPPRPLPEHAAALRRAPRPLSWAIEDLLTRVPAGAMDEVAELSPENAERVAWLFENEEYDTPLDLRPDCHKEGTTYGAVYGRMKWDEPAPTLTTGFLTPGRGRFIHPLRQRTLTPREAARLQGFPDWFDFVGASTAPTRRELGKWIGNAVPSILGYTASLSALAAETSG